MLQLSHIIFLLSIPGILCSNGPNILFIVADDLGWNDVSWHNEKVVTPNLHKLYQRSVRLENYYVQPTCSPSRSSFLTGIYPHKIGMTEEMPSGIVSGCLNTNLKLLPHLLRTHGYRTHLIGKWHLGFCDWRCTPTYRGFDTFYGHYDGLNDHFTHRHGVPWSNNSLEGLDFRDNHRLVLDQNGTYSADSLTNRAVKIIRQSSEPFFMMLSFTVPHFPLQVEEKFRKIYENSTLSKTRKTYLGMVSALDHSVGILVDELDRTGLRNNTIIVFTSDNGGEVNFGGNNWPLRGQKYGIFEGGTKSLGFLTTPKLEPRDYENLFHAVDWFSTIQSAAGIDITSSKDSIDHWSNFHSDAAVPRNEIIYNIRPGSAGIRNGRYKLILGDPDPLINSYDWYPENHTYNPNIENVHGNYSNKIWLFDLKSDPEERRNLADDFEKNTHFGLDSDPEERENLADDLEDIVRELRERLERHLKDYRPNRMGKFPLIGNADPRYWGDAWSPGWCIAD